MDYSAKNASIKDTISQLEYILDKIYKGDVAASSKEVDNIKERLIDLKGNLAYNTVVDVDRSIQNRMSWGKY